MSHEQNAGTLTVCELEHGHRNRGFTMIFPIKHRDFSIEIVFFFPINSIVIFPSFCVNAKNRPGFPVDLVQ